MLQVRVLALMMTLALILTACGGKSQDEAARIRQELQQAQSLTADLTVTADYGERVYTFGLRYEGDLERGTLTVTEPELIRGVTATTEAGSCTLTYDGVDFDTGDLAPGIRPMSVMALLMEQWCSGLVQSVSREQTEKGKALCVNTRYDEQITQSTWFDLQTHLPVRAEVYRNGKMMLSVAFADVTIS